MAQSSQTIANGAGSAVRSAMNTLHAALYSLSSGTSAPSDTSAHMLWADTTNSVLWKRNAANSGWIFFATLSESFVLARSSNTMLDIADNGKAIVATSTFTQTFDTSANLKDGWTIAYKNNGVGVITLQAGSGTIDGLSSITLAAGASCVVWCNGTNLFTFGGSAPAATPVSIQGAIRKFKASYSTTTTITMTCDEVVLKNSGGTAYLASGVSLTVNSATSGANGLDTGSIANSTWYYYYIIYNGSTVAGLISTSATTPTMPSGYTYATKALGAVRTNGSAQFIGFDQINDLWNYRVGSNLSAYPVIASSTQGDVTTPTWVQVDITGLAPYPSSSFLASVTVLGNGVNGAGANLGMIAPNASFGAYNTSSNPAPLSNSSTAIQATFVLTDQYVRVAQQANYHSHMVGFRINMEA